MEKRKQLWFTTPSDALSVTVDRDVLFVYVNGVGRCLGFLLAALRIVYITR